MDQDAKNRALSLLNRRDYSRKMLIDKLTEKGASEEDAVEVADWLVSLGVIDDARYGALVVRHYDRKGYGIRRIKEELFRRGIDKELWDVSLEEISEPGDTVYRLLCRKLRASASPEDLDRAANFLLRRGYSREEIRGALERYSSEIGENE